MVNIKTSIREQHLISEQTLGIVLNIAIIIGAIYTGGKVLRLMGETVKDVRFFVEAIQNR